MSLNTETQLKNEVLGESSQLALEKYNIESRLESIEIRLKELLIASSTINVLIKSNKNKDEKSKDEKSKDEVPTV